MAAATARAALLRCSAPLRAATAARAAELSPSPLRRLRSMRPSSSTARLLRCPVELGACVETLVPRHTATAAAVMTSMLDLSRSGYGWHSKGGCPFYPLLDATKQSGFSRSGAPATITSWLASQRLLGSSHSLIPGND